MAFHDVRFPTEIALGASGGPERRTEIVALASGREERNSPWAHSRRRYEAGYGVRSIDDLYAVAAFFEARQGRLHGFRWRDAMDYKSCAPSAEPSALDQQFGEGTGAQSLFQLTKTYISGAQTYVRPIHKPVADEVLVAIDGAPASGFSVNAATGEIAFNEPPPQGTALTAGFYFDVPARFDTDSLIVNLTSFAAGEIPSIPVVELRL